jgi:ATP-binding cassette subfamily B protein
MRRILPPAVAATVQELLSGARWALRVGWSTSAPLMLGAVGLAVVRGAVPAALALTARGLVNATMAGLHGDSGLSGLAIWLVLGFALTVIDGVARLANNLVGQRFRDDLNFSLTSDILQHAATLDVAFFEDARSQDVLQRAKDNPAERVARFITELVGVLSNGVQVVSLLALLAVIEPLILLVLVPFTLPYLRFQWRLATRQHALERSRTTKRRWTNYFVSTLTGRASVGEVRILGLAPLLIDRFRALMAEFRDQDRRLYIHGFTGSSVFVAVTTGAIYAMFVRVAYRVLNGKLTIGDLAIFGGATTRLRNTLESLIYSVSTAMEQTLYIANVMEFLAVRPSPAGTAGVTPAARRAEIELRDVRFTYPGSPQPALDGISLHILPGETVALVGENGAGKTTLVKLIARLYDPDQGCILFDGVDLRELSPEFLHAELAFVFQGFGHYEATAADNIAYGDWRRLLHDREAVQRIAEQAGVDAMLRALPNGYDTMLGRMFGDHDPSGGQWQKIAVARAFARNASLLIFDEPTSNLDARAEYELFCRFRDLAKGRTTIIVSHRFSTVSMANRILVMDRGHIIESGTHEELLACAGSYADLYELHRRQMDAASLK